MSEQLNQAQLTAPKTIYLHDDDEDARDVPADGVDGFLWRQDQLGDNDVRYIRADIAEAQIEQLRASITELKGVRPSFDLTAGPDGLPRCGIRWGGPGVSLLVPMTDGYWTPWHIASARISDLEARAEAWRHCANEWADAATNAPVFLSNLRGGGTVDELMALSKADIERAKSATPPAALRDASNPRGILDSSTVTANRETPPHIDAITEIIERKWALLSERRLEMEALAQNFANHLRDVTKMIDDRQLADAVNELRDIAIKYHATHHRGPDLTMFHADRAELLLDSEQPKADTVAVSRKALEALQESLIFHDASMDEIKGFAAGLAIRAARRLLDGGE